MTNTASATSVDISKFMEAMNAMDSRNIRLATRRAFRLSASVVKKAVQSEYKNTYPGSQLWKDVHMKDFRSGKGAIIDILYTRKWPKSSPMYKSFVMPMLSGGTIERYSGTYGAGKKMGRASAWYNRKDGAYEGIELSSRLYRGRVEGSQFFKRGVDKSLSEAMASLQGNIEKAVVERAKKVGAV